MGVSVRALKPDVGIVHAHIAVALQRDDEKRLAGRYEAVLSGPEIWAPALLQPESGRGRGVDFYVF